MQCTSCNYDHSRVVETTQDERNNRINRRRECIKCGQRYTTHEKIRDAGKPSDYKTPPPRSVLEK